MPTDGPTLDEGVLTELTETAGGDIGFVVELIDTFLADTPAQLDAMAARSRPTTPMRWCGRPTP